MLLPRPENQCLIHIFLFYFIVTLHSDSLEKLKINVSEFKF